MADKVRWDRPAELEAAQRIQTMRDKELRYAVWTQRNWTRRMTNRLLDVQKDLNFRLVQLGWDPLHLLRRERWREFVVRTVRYMAAGKDRTQAGKMAAKETFSQKYGHSGWSDKSLTKFTNNILQKPEVCVAIEVLFERAGLSPDDAARLHINHIKGMPVQTVDDQGNVKTHTAPPNYQALKDYWGMTFPKPPSKFDVTSEHFFGVGQAHPLDQTPVIEARLLEEGDGVHSMIDDEKTGVGDSGNPEEPAVPSEPEPTEPTTDSSEASSDA